MARDALGRQHGALDEGLGRGPGGQAAGEADGGQAAGQLAGDDGGVGQEDGAVHQVEQGRPGRGREERWEDAPGVPEPEAVEDGRDGQGAELVGCL